MTDSLECFDWSERVIASALATQTFQRKAVVITPNCNWTGYECDLLVVEQRLRVIDVEIKISRSDLKKDAGKDKWWHRQYGPRAPGTYRQEVISTARPHPPRIWKHYYAMPERVWDDSLLQFLPSQASGVITLKEKRGLVVATVVKRAKPNNDAYVLTPAQAVDVARLANLRYWDARHELDNARSRIKEMRERELMGAVNGSTGE